MGENIAKRAEEASNVLIISSSNSSEDMMANFDTVLPEESQLDSVLTTTFAQSIDDHYQAVQQHLCPSPSDINIITIGDQIRAKATQGASASFLFMNDIRIITVHSFNLTQLGVSIYSYLNEETENTSESAVFMNSVSELLQRANEQDVFRFLHVVTEMMAESNATGYYQIDCDCDEQTLATLFPLFDTVITLDEESMQSVRSPVLKPELGNTESPPPANESRTARTFLDMLSERASWLWLLAIATFGFFDIFSTIIGLQTGMAVEASPIAAQVINTNGLGFIYIIKFIIIGLFYLLWSITPAPHRIGIPFGLSLLGVTVTVWNSAILLETLL